MKAEVRARLLANPSSGSARAEIAQLVHSVAPLLPTDERAVVVAELMAEVEGLGPLEPLLADPEVDEVLVNAGRDVWVERRGQLECCDVSLDRGAVERLVERIIAPLGLRADRTAPMVDARLADGSRVNAILPPLAIDGPCLTIRRFRPSPLPLDAFASSAVARLLRQAVESRKTILVSGGTSTGKTTLLGALAASIPGHERIITVEDAAELRLSRPHVVRLEARPANAEGVGEVTVRDLVRNSLRMRPDRIVVGEVRGAEALDMLQAMNTGHEGSLSTCHANSAADALRRLETLALMAGIGLPLAAVREQVASAIDLVVQLARVADGRRGVVEVCEVSPPAELGEPAALNRVA